MKPIAITMSVPKKNRSNWGWGITGVYLVFVIGIMYLVWRTTREQQDLVTEDYYAQEIKYQDRIDASKRAAALSSPVRVELRDHSLHLAFPREFAGKTLTGEVLVYYPADSKKDVRVPVNVTDNAMDLKIDAANTGLHILQLSWQEGSTTYYQESDLDIP